MKLCLNGAIPSRKCSVNAPAKWRHSVYVLMEICHQRSKWLGPWSSWRLLSSGSALSSVGFGALRRCFKPSLIVQRLLCTMKNMCHKKNSQLAYDMIQIFFFCLKYSVYSHVNDIIEIERSLNSCQNYKYQKVLHLRNAEIMFTVLADILTFRIYRILENQTESIWFLKWSRNGVLFFKK